MVGAVGLGADEGVDRGVVLASAPGLQLAAAVAVERRLGEDLAGEADAGAQVGPVALLGQVVGLDHGMLARVGRAQLSQPRLKGRIVPAWAWKACILPLERP